MTFAAALKAFLRQDPDIIMVGEIRDLSTAEIAIKAAMTGHLVFSTLHTNDCPSTIGRLVDIGIPPYMLASSVSMVLSQRLARKLCPQCKALVEDIDPAELEELGFAASEIPKLNIYEAVGCSACIGSGYKGRVGLYELMEVTGKVANVISAGVCEDQLRKAAIQEGMLTLRDAGLEKIRQGVISIEEVLKRTTVTKESMPAYLVNPEIVQYEDRDVILHEGNKDSDFYRLVQGALIVMKNGRKISTIQEPGEYFGEMAALTGETRTTTIISRGRSVIERFPGDKLPEIIEKYPAISRTLLETVAGRLAQADKTIVHLINKGRKAQVESNTEVKDASSRALVAP